MFWIVAKTETPSTWDSLNIQAKQEIKKVSLPTQAGGGSYLTGPDFNKVIPTPRDYAGIAPVADSQRDHIIAVALGGTSDPDNIKIQQAKAAAYKDKVENYYINQYKAGKVNLTMAKVKVLNWDNVDIPNQKAFNKELNPNILTKIKNFFSKDVPNAGDVVGKTILDWMGIKPETYVSDFMAKVKQFENQPLQTLKEAGKAAIQAPVQAVKGLGMATEETLQAFEQKKSPAEKTADILKQYGAAANVLFSPITAVFNAAEKIPVLKPAADIIALPFTATGKLGQFAGEQFVNVLPIDQQSKNVLKPAFGEVGALAGQIILGSKIVEAISKGNKIDQKAIDEIVKSTKIEVKGTPGATGEVKVNFIPPEQREGVKIAQKGVPEAISAEKGVLPQETPKTPTGEEGFVNVGAGIEGVKENIQSVKDYVDQRTQQMELGKDTADNYYRLIKDGKKVDDIMTKRILDKADISPEDQQAIYNWMENPKEPITEVQKAKYDSYIKPLTDKSTELYNKIKNKDIPIPVEDSPSYATRVVKGRGSFLDRLKAGFKGTGTGSLLSKTAGFLKKRTMMAVEDEAGNRVIVSIKDGRVTGWNKGEGFDMGRLNVTDYETIMDKELKPVDAKIKKLDAEMKTIGATKAGIETRGKRIVNIYNEIQDLTKQRNAIEAKYNPANLNGKIFVDSNKGTWKIADATTKEIETNTSLKYYKTPLVNELQKFNRLNQISRAIDFLESTKTNLEGQGVIKKFGSYDIPKDWKMTDLPQFRGYLMPKRIANVLDTFYGQIKSGNTGALTKINLFLRTTIFFNPLIHVPNIAVHWVVARGWQWANPIGYPRMITAGVKAIRDVLTLNDDYIKALDKGAPLLFSETKNADLYKAYLDKASYELADNPTMIDTIKKAFKFDNPTAKKVIDFINPYKVSGKVTWAVNDIATLQAIYEEMGQGKTWEAAISDVGKHIPNYRLPADLLGSKQVMDIIKSPNVTMFSAYHYGALKSYFEMMKSLVIGDKGPKDIQGRIDAAGKIAMLGIVTFVIYPELDKLIKKITGNQNAYVRRAGASTFIYNTANLAQGKMGFTNWLTSVITPSVVISAPLDIAQGYLKVPTLTEMKADPAGTAKQFSTDLAGNMISPYGYIQGIVSGKKTLGNTLLQFIGISTPNSTKSQQGVDSLIYDERPKILSKAKGMISSRDVAGAYKLISTYNKSLYGLMVGMFQDRGMTKDEATSMVNNLINNPDAKVAGYFIKGITQEQMKNYQAKQNQTSLENLILK